MSAPIFISCSSQDRKAAETICKAVEQRGLQCWISSRNIGPGENFQESITRAIRSAKLMILVFSANANNSLEVKKEIALAGRYNVVVVPVRVEDVVPNDALSYELAVRQWIDMFDNWEDAIERLVLQLSAVIQADAAAAPGAKGAAVASATAPAAPPQPETPHPSAAAAERGRPSVLPLIAAAVVVILITLAGAGWFFWPMSRNRTAEQAPTATNPAQPAAAPPTAAVPPGAPAPLRETLSAHVAAALPRLSQNIREDLARDYVTATGHKALAGPLNAEGHWRSFDRRTPEIARDGALEGCQVQYGEPCALLAVDDTIEPVPAGRKLAGRDMPRTHYAGEFDPAQIPGLHFFGERADVAGYGAAAAPKAAAYHPVRGRFFTVTGSATQHAAEEQALKRCNDDPVRNGSGGPCFLYAVDNRVVLPLRLHEPMTTALSAAAASKPPAQPAPAITAPPAASNASLHDALLARLVTAIPRGGEHFHEPAVRTYVVAAPHKAEAVPASGAGHWESSERSTAESASEAVLEGCQVQYGEPCMLAALDDAVQPVGADGKWATHDMSRPRYAGEFDPAQIPSNPLLRERSDILGYRAAAMPKAAAYHPVRGRFFTVTAAASQYTAEEQALKRCNDDPLRKGAGGPCFLYAVENRVVLPLRLREPLTAAPSAAAQPKPAAQSAAAPQAQQVAAVPNPADLKPRGFRDCPNCPEMVVVPAGKFEMGAADGEPERFEVPSHLAGYEQPRHEVAIAKPFALAKYEVTRGEFSTFVKATKFHVGPGCVAPVEGRPGRNAELNWENPGFQQTERDPVVCVNGADIGAYLEWLRKTTGKPYRLPSEAEFEYAARGGTTTPFYWGSDPDKVCEYENIGDQSAAEGFRQASFAAMPCRDGFARTAPVGSFKPNPFGLYDMLGNVWEITADCWAGDYAGAPADGSARTTGDCGLHAARKGSFGNGRPGSFRAAHRFSEPVGIKRNRSGFRVALSLP